MVTSKDEEIFWVLDLVGKKKADCLQRLLPSVDVISKEQVVGFWWETTVFEEPKKVIVLAMDIACRA